MNFINRFGMQERHDSMTNKIFNGTLAASLVSVIITFSVTAYSFFLSVSKSGTDKKEVFNMLFHSAYILLPIVVASVLIAFLAAYRVTRGIVVPIEKMGDDLENIDDNCPFDELEPFAEKIELQLEEKEKLEKVKKKFTANVSHELKTPLTAISGYGEMLQSGMVNESDVAGIGGIIYKESQRLINLTHDIIQLSQLEEYDYKPIMDSVDLYSVAKSCTEALYVQAQKRNVEIKLSGVSVLIKGTESLMEELVYNLVENAIKYNVDGGIVSICVEDKGDICVLTVKDTGIGIPSKYKDRVFDRFFRVDKSRSKETGGTGLGLAIVKHTAEYLGGSVAIESEENKGTQITVKLAKQ